jgi:hypothetical protein
VKQLGGIAQPNAESPELPCERMAGKKFFSSGTVLVGNGFGTGGNGSGTASELRTYKQLRLLNTSFQLAARSAAKEVHLWRPTRLPAGRRSHNQWFSRSDAAAVYFRSFSMSHDSSRCSTVQMSTRQDGTSLNVQNDGT